jgi:hypothetical protein
MKNTLRLCLITLAPFAVVACGGGPDIDQVKKDFESPSGSVGSKDTVIAANGEREAGGPAIALAGGGVPGAALTSNDPGLASLNVMRNFGERARSLYRGLRSGSKEQALAVSQVDPGERCADSEVARMAYEEMITDLFLDALNPLGGDLNGSADYEIDLGTCSEGQLTGRLAVEIEVTLADNRFEFKVTEEFDEVCETNETAACVSGELIMEASANSTGESADNFTFVTAWELDTKWNDNGTSREATISGGLRIASMTMGTAQTSSIEYLFYVNDAEGEQVSYVWRLTADEMGNVTFDIRGRDGSLSCAISNDGGMCTAVGGDGTVTLTWTAAEAASLSEVHYED